MAKTEKPDPKKTPWPPSPGGNAPPGRSDGKYINAPFWKKGHRG